MLGRLLGNEVSCPRQRGDDPTVIYIGEWHQGQDGQGGAEDCYIYVLSGRGLPGPLGIYSN